MMESKTYQAVTMAEALTNVKRDLGRDAVILQTRRVRKGGVLGLLGGHSLWEVQAAPHNEAMQEFYISEKREEAPESVPSLEAEPSVPELPRIEEVARRETSMAVRMEEIHQMVEQLLQSYPESEQNLPPAISDLRRHLLEQEVREDIVNRLIHELHLSVMNQVLPDEEALKTRLIDLMAERIRTSGSAFPSRTTGRPYVISLIGPTGVGKTTTIAKLAANYRLREKKKVALITLDTYRIAAVEQLRTYADIIDIPLKAIFTPGELHAAILEHSAADVILIDTAGRSQNNGDRLSELGRFLDAAESDEVHLVISASSSPKVAQATCKRFGSLGANRIVMTKLDEAESFGMILNITAATEASISYITTGQGVPEDMAVADSARLARCVVKGNWNDC
jgi:flagellar biosynthesis protein FlhF